MEMSNANIMSFTCISFVINFFPAEQTLSDCQTATGCSASAVGAVNCYGIINPRAIGSVHPAVCILQ